MIDMKVADFRHMAPLTPRFGDFDMLGHVNNAKYLTYLEQSRLMYFHDVMGWDGTPENLSLILASAQIDYKAPIMWQETIQIYTRCLRLGNKSFDLAYLLCVKDTEKIAAQAITTLVAFDYQKGQSIRITDEWRAAVTDYERLSPQTS